MTTTTTTEFRSSHPSHVRRNVVSAFAAAAILASTALAVGRINDGDSPRVARATNESTLGVTQMNGAFHAAFVPAGATPLPGIGDIYAGATSVNPASAGVTAEDVCAGGLAWACSYTPQSTEIPRVVTAADVCAGGLGWACVYTPAQG